MKTTLRLILCVAGMLFFCTFLNAQDLITKTDGTTIEAFIVEIGERSISYKEFNRQQMPEKYILVSKVRSIKFSNGETRYFSAAPVTAGNSTFSLGMTTKNSYAPNEIRFSNSFFVNYLDGNDNIVTHKLADYMSSEEATQLEKLRPWENACRFMSIACVVTASVGLTVGITVDKEKNPQLKKTFIIIGVAGAVGSVAFLVTGISLDKKAISIVNQYNHQKGYSSNLNFGVTENGIGLAFNF